MSGLELLLIPAIGAGASVVNAGYNVIKGQSNNGNGASGKPAKHPYLTETTSAHINVHHYGTSTICKLPNGGFMASSQGDNSGGFIISTTTTHTEVRGFPNKKADGKWWHR